MYRYYVTRLWSLCVLYLSSPSHSSCLLVAKNVYHGVHVFVQWQTFYIWRKPQEIMGFKVQWCPCYTVCEGPLLFHSSEVPPWSLKEQQVPVSAQTWANAVRTLSTIPLKNTHRHGSVTVSKFPQITICLDLRHINRSKKNFKHMYNCILIHFRSLKYLKFCLVCFWFFLEGYYT